MKSILKVIDSISEWLGKIISFLVIVVTVVILYEVVARYVFSSPTIWAFEISLALYGFYVVLLGAYVLRVGGHVNVDIVYRRFSPRARAIVNLFTWLLFFFWIGVLVWQGCIMSWFSLTVGECWDTPFGFPIYPVKLSIPLGAFFIFLQGLAGYARNVTFAITGREI